MHDYTKTGMCRNISELFYWPEGLGLDTVVVTLFFLVGAGVLIDGIMLVQRLN